MSKLLMVSDLHFTDKKADAHRFDLFRQVSSIIDKYGITEIAVLGDLTDAKSGHSSKLVNTIVDYLKDWTSLVGQVFVLSGNHDLIDSNYPYFRFLQHLEGIEYIYKPTEYAFGEHRAVFLPHTRDPIEDWKGLDFTDKLVFGHVTVNDCISENLQKLTSSVEASLFDKAKMAFSGDIHLQQQCGCLVYVGSPFDTRFNAANVNHPPGRGVILDLQTLKTEDVTFKFPRRYTFDIETTEELVSSFKDLRKTSETDQVKVRLHITKENMGTWRDTKSTVQEFIRESGKELCGFDLVPEYKDVSKTALPAIQDQFLDFSAYAKLNKIEGDLLEKGREIVRLCEQAS